MHELLHIRLLIVFRSDDDDIDLSGHGAESADDEILVGRLTEQVRSAIQAMLDHAVDQRRSVWFG